jgi:hypothetical protein
MYIQIAKILGLCSIPLFGAITICYGLSGQIGNAIVNLGITILYFGLFYLVIFKGIM